MLASNTRPRGDGASRRACAVVRRWMSASEEYQRKTPLEHVLLRPSMYVGSTDKHQSSSWVIESGKMVKTSVECVPAMLKVFDEILVNAADNKQRDPNMSKIDVTINTTDPRFPEIIIENDGRGIPVLMHEIEGIYVPELIFGHLLTGSNFDDSRESYTGGRHGYGAKLTNIFSKRFQVTTYDKERKLQYSQTWTNNMLSCDEAEITEMQDTRDFTRISFIPDLGRFGLETLDNDHLSLLHRRCYDIAACLPGVAVSLNGHKLPVNNFRDYVKLFCKPGEEPLLHIASASNKHWEVAVKRSHGNSFDHMSFVNSMHTPRGGTHVNLLTAQLCRAFEEALAKKGHKISPTYIKNKFFIFIRALVQNPSFDSQTKESLTSKQTDSGVTCSFSPKLLKQFVEQSGILEELIEEIRLREQAELLRKAPTGASKRMISVNVPKLEDAYSAGTSKADECTLILTEGDSAKALAVAGLEVVGREYYGVMPLRGKVLNVRDTSSKQLASNEEVLNLCTALGLDFTKTYEEGVEGLRYGRVMLMTDQDHDGSHIKGLVINFFQYFWPALLKRDDFLQQFITPLVKVTKSGKISSFYSLQEYREWEQAHTRESHRVKYYKGLGTSTAVEAKDYFKAIERHRKDFYSKGDEAEAVDLAFAKHRAADRRIWIGEKFDPETFIDPKEPRISYEDFVHKELIHFSHADNLRSIPNVIDGLKPSHRKVLYACFKKKLTAEIKVVQLAGYCAEHTCYHHGEAALHSCIINMAQDFVGSNNIPLLVPSGQFGTRAQGGKDFASPRYLFTRLSPITRKIFPEADDCLLESHVEDGQEVEPKYFVPIIPMLLINGSDGIGTGWSTTIPQYSPFDVLDRIRLKLLKEPEPNGELQPWTRGFQGEVVLKTSGKSEADGCATYVTRGVIGAPRSTQLVISELPVGSWTSDYKEFLNTLVTSGRIKQFRECHTARHVKFEILTTTANILEFRKVGLHKAFQLVRPLRTSNMHAFTPDYKIHKFKGPEEVLDMFLPVRLELYSRRKAMLTANYQFQMCVHLNRARFVQEICSGHIEILGKGGGVSRTELEAILLQRSYEPIEKLVASRDSSSSIKTPVHNASHMFEYLLEMPIQSLTRERYQKLHEAAVQSETALKHIQHTSAEKMWLEELNDLEKQLKSYLKEDGDIKY